MDIDDPIFYALMTFYAGPDPIKKLCPICHYCYEVRYAPKFIVGGGQQWELGKDEHICPKKEKPEDGHVHIFVYEDSFKRCIKCGQVRPF